MSDMEETYLTSNSTQLNNGDENKFPLETGQCIFIVGICLFLMVVVKIGRDIKSNIADRNTTENNADVPKLNISSKDRRTLLETILVSEIFSGDNNFESKVDKKTEETSATFNQDIDECSLGTFDSHSCRDMHNKEISFSGGSNISKAVYDEENQVQSENIIDIENCNESGQQAKVDEGNETKSDMGNPQECERNYQFESIDCRSMLLGLGNCVKSIQIPRLEEQEPQQQADETAVLPEEECSICLSEFFVGEEIMRVKSGQTCTHKFHKSCLLSWLDSHNFCPLCRFEMVNESELEEAMKETGISPSTEDSTV